MERDTGTLDFNLFILLLTSDSSVHLMFLTTVVSILELRVVAQVQVKLGGKAVYKLKIMLNNIVSVLTLPYIFA